MPYKQRTQCRHPDCPVLIPVGSKYCDAHRRQHKETVRSAASRGYTSRWQRISRQYLRQHPLCVRCGRPAQVVDHIVPHRGREQLFWDESNWQALCKACHDRKTGEEDSRPTYEY
ncbi:HNH endonuclease [Ruminococcus sp.]|jgi:5-methylcytosine-specific restriction protein A|uniref:HNH endonuclease n=1 Tax=Ruminococcus sp. TaxID=41978 RepID=UPI003079FDF3